MINNYLLWIKIESGGLAFEQLADGLGYQQYPIFEVSVVATDTFLDKIFSYRAPIHFEHEQAVALSSEYAINVHTQSGLLRECDESGISITEAEDSIISLLIEHGAEPFSASANCVALMAGQNLNSHELWFVAHQMPKLKKFLHFSTFDLSSFILAQNMWNSEASSERSCYQDWSDDSSSSKIDRMISTAKYFKPML